jgi:hypothetical protein
MMRNALIWVGAFMALALLSALWPARTTDQRCHNEG